MEADEGLSMVDVKLITAAEAKEATERIKNQQVNVDERVKVQLEHIAYYIHDAASKGKYDASIILSEEINQEVIYPKVVEILRAKGYQVELSNHRHDSYIVVNWS